MREGGLCKAGLDLINNEGQCSSTIHVDMDRSMPPTKQGRQQCLAYTSNPPGAQQLDDLISHCSLFAPLPCHTEASSGRHLSRFFSWLAFLLPPSLHPSLLHPCTPRLSGGCPSRATGHLECLWRTWCWLGQGGVCYTLSA